MPTRATLWFAVQVIPASRIAAVGHLPDTQVDAALVRIGQQTRHAVEAGATWVAFPEGTMLEYRPGVTSVRNAAESLEGPFVTALVNLAGEHDVVISAGMWEQAADGERPYNTQVVVSGAGVLAAYRKAHLFDALGHRESDDIQSGPALPVTLSWSGFTVGLLTCYDIRFPEQARALIDAGADVLLVAAAWAAGEGKRQQWRTLLAARAIENTSYVVAAGLVSPRHDGPSAIIDPLGQALSEGDPHDASVVVADLSQDHLRAVRERIPSLHHRRWRIDIGGDFD